MEKKADQHRLDLPGGAKSTDSCTVNDDDIYTSPKSNRGVYLLLESKGVITGTSQLVPTTRAASFDR